MRRRTVKASASADSGPAYRSDFLCRAYRYRERPNRSPREDFMTECLAELLNALSNIEHGRYAPELLGLGSMVELRPRLRWSSQVALPDIGRPDLVAHGKTESGEDVFLIVENKIGAGYTQDQLSRYRTYLRDSRDRHKALVLITHWTASSKDADHVVRWREIAGTLKKWKQERLLAEHPLAEALSGWLMRFMKEEDMSEIKLDLVDMASVSRHRNLIDACRALRAVIDDIAQSLDQSLNQALGQEPEDKRLNVPRPRGWGEFSYGDYGVPFFGRIWTPGGAKVNDTNVVLWTGIWTGEEIYEVVPTIPNVPEFSAGIGLWGADAERLPRARDLLKDAALPETWELAHFDNAEAVVIRRTLPLTQVFDPETDWEGSARRFFEECCAELSRVSKENGDAIRNIVAWEEGEDDGEDEAEVEAEDGESDESN